MPGADGRDQGYAIVKYEPDAGEQAALTSIAVKKQVISAGATHRVRGECAGDTLRMSVDGTTVLTARNAAPLEAVEHSGVVVYPAVAGSDVRFDNVAIDTLLAPTLTAREKAVALVTAAAGRAYDSPIVAVTCPKPVQAGEIGLLTCAVTFAGPACQLWMVIDKGGEDKPLPFGEPVEGRRGSYDEASGTSKCLETN